MYSIHVIRAAASRPPPMTLSLLKISSPRGFLFIFSFDVVLYCCSYSRVRIASSIILCPLPFPSPFFWFVGVCFGFVRVR